MKSWLFQPALPREVEAVNFGSVLGFPPCSGGGGLRANCMVGWKIPGIWAICAPPNLPRAWAHICLPPPETSRCVLSKTKHKPDSPVWSLQTQRQEAEAAWLLARDSLPGDSRRGDFLSSRPVSPCPRSLSFQPLLGACTRVWGAPGEEMFEAVDG